MPYKNKKDNAKAARRWRKNRNPPSSEARKRANERRRKLYWANPEESRRRKREASKRAMERNPNCLRERRRRFKEQRPDLYKADQEARRVANKLKIPRPVARDFIAGRVSYETVANWNRRSNVEDKLKQLREQRSCEDA